MKPTIKFSNFKCVNENQRQDYSVQQEPSESFVIKNLDNASTLLLDFLRKVIAWLTTNLVSTYGSLLSLDS